MFLKFIGQDGSMRLKHDKVYNVRIESKNNYIWVVIPRFEFRHMVFDTWKCPYSSPQSFAANWTTINRKESQNDITKME